MLDRDTKMFDEHGYVFTLLHQFYTTIMPLKLRALHCSKTSIKEWRTRPDEHGNVH